MYGHIAKEPSSHHSFQETLVRLVPSFDFHFSKCFSFSVLIRAFSAGVRIAEYVAPVRRLYTGARLTGRSPMFNAFGQVFAPGTATSLLGLLPSRLMH
jgi:hypothetical protein